MTDSKTREAFEAFMRSRNACVRLHRQRPELGGFYRTVTVQRAWEQWQAARRAALGEAAKACENDVDDVSYVHGGTTYDDAGRTRYNCAAAIRALADETQEGQP